MPNAPVSAPATQAGPKGAERDWLALGPASRLLGVDPDTLRRWADDGRVEAYLTPGGHRRFDRAALVRILNTRRNANRTPMTSLGATPEQLSRAYRRSYASPRSVVSASALRQPDRDGFRDEGRRLVEALLAYLDARQPGDRRRAEEDAGARTEDVARRLAAAGTPLADAVAQFVAARRPFLTALGSLAARRKMDVATLSTVYQHASDLLDRMLLRLVAAWMAAQSPTVSGPPAGSSARGGSSHAGTSADAASIPIGSDGSEDAAP
jgi:excisionase family DNA binding protein